VFVWAKVNERVYGGYALPHATLRVSKDPQLGTVDITINDPTFEAHDKSHGGGITLRREDAMWLANALMLALGKKKAFTYMRHSRDRGTRIGTEPHGPAK
jgi:hypothetical protein